MDKTEVVKKVHALMNDKNNYTARLQAEEIVENYAEAKAGQHETIVMWPDHLKDDAPEQTCTVCNRKTWSKDEFHKSCNFPQPDGTTCKGYFK